MMENMSEEQLRSMAAMMPGGAAVSGASGWGDEWRSLGCGKARSLGLRFSMQRSWADAAFAFLCLMCRWTPPSSRWRRP